MAIVSDTRAEEHRIATDGKTVFVIVTPAQPIAEETTAADWLATTLKQITGHALFVKQRLLTES